MERSLGVAVFWAAIWVSAPAVAADERVVMPFACSVQNGRVVMTPSPDRSYRIIGRHEQQPYTACPPGQPDRCATWMLHRFDIMCGETRVAWMHAVAAAMQRIDGRLSIEQGRLRIPMRDAPAVAVAPCSTAPGPTAPGGASGIRPAVERACGPPLSADASVSLPAGYAPVMRLGARFLSPSDPSVASPATAASASLIIKVADVGAAVASSAESSISRIVSETGNDAALSGWITQTRAAVLGESYAARLSQAVRRNSTDISYYWVSVLAMSAIMVIVWLCQRTAGGAHLGDLMRSFASRLQVSSFRWRTSSPENPAAAADAAKRCAELIRAADRLHQIVRAAVADLAQQPLKKVLERELAGIEATLLAPELTRLSAARRWDKVEARMRVVRRDLERIHRIATTASTLVPGLRNSDAMPTSEAEAREVLGVSAVADERIVKKVVDALRQSWHPDHASDPGDRSAREQRLKQINVAWDIISRRRQEKAA